MSDPVKSSAIDTPDLTTVVAKFTEFLDSVESLVPGYQVPHKSEAARAASTARFAEPLIEPTATALQSSTHLRDHSTFDPVAGREAIEYRNLVRSLGQRMATIGAALIYSGDVRLAGTARALLQTYSFAKRLARDPEGAGLRSYVNTLGGAMKKTINHRPKVAAATPTPTFLASSVALADDDMDDVLEPDGLLPDIEEQ